MNLKANSGLKEEVEVKLGKDTGKPGEYVFLKADEVKGSNGKNILASVEYFMDPFVINVKAGQ